MSDANHDDPTRTRRRAGSSWKREVVELAVLFVAVGLAHLLATLLGHSDPGPGVLIALGVALLGCAFLHKRIGGWRAFRRRADGAATLEEGRPMKLWRIRTRVVDRPGRLAELAAAFARLRCNVLAMHIAAAGGGASPSGCDALDEFVVEAATGLSEKDLRSAVKAAGGLDIAVVRAHVKDLVDPGVQALVLAHSVSDDPERLPDAMAELLRAPDVQWRRPGDTLVGGRDPATTMVISVHAERALLISRPALPFTPTEAARATALAAGVRHRRYSGCECRS
jgi:hypothetical protein